MGGSAALEMCNAAMGRLDVFYEFGINTWDIAAGVIIVEEAGGFVSSFDDLQGSDYNLERRRILCGNPRICLQLREMLDSKCPFIPS